MNWKIGLVFMSFTLVATNLWAQGQVPFPKNVNDQIRALEDPDYEKYVQNKKLAKKKQMEAVDALKEERRRNKEEREKARLERIKERKSWVAPDNSQAYQAHLEEKRRLRERQSLARQEHSQIRGRQIVKKEELMAKFRNKWVDREAPQRLPASQEPPQESQ